MATLAHSAAGLGQADDVFGLVGRNVPVGVPGPPAPPPPHQGGPPPSSPVPDNPQDQGGGPLRAKDFPPPTQAPGGGGTPPPQYDVSSDPVLQIVNAQLALADSNAHAAALQAREQALLAYGDSNLARSVLGADDPLAQAAGQNQESTLSLLARASGQSMQNFEHGLDPSLAFSGYRVGQEGRLSQAYQDALARAAADIQNQLTGITGSENAQLENDATARAQALADAYARAIQQALLAGGG